MLKINTWLRASDEGSATMAGVGVVVAIVTLLGSLAIGARIMIVIAQARSVADMSALSAAQALWEYGNNPCSVAAVVASSNSAQLKSCVVESLDVQVCVEYATQVPFVEHIQRASRAGPRSCVQDTGTS